MEVQVRYMSSFDMGALRKEDYDVLVVGTGIAGLFAALNISHEYRVLLITKDRLEKNNSNLAQGGIAACIDPQDFEAHYEDTLRAGSYHNEKDATHVMIEEAPISIEKLMEYGVNLDRDSSGRLMVTREGGHSKRRVLHVKDATGREIIRALGEEIRKRPNIILQEKIFAIDILTDQDRCIGILALNEKGEKLVFKSNAVVISSGGIGQVYKNSTNPEVATGDGIAMAFRAGAKIEDMEFIQFHPTALYTPEPGQKFLISEAVRGEGAILRNIHGEAFMEKIHEMKDLAPRDIVARNIFNQIEKTKTPYVYLDITHKGREFIMERFPTIYKRCLSEGIDMTKEYIPVAPAEHYVMGGIGTDLDGETGITGLYACGECARTGVHGANRLASNSLLEGAVFGHRTALSINKNLYQGLYGSPDVIINHKTKNILRSDHSTDYDSLRDSLVSAMEEYVSIIRSEEGLLKAKKETESIMNTLIGNPRESIPYFELMNMVTVALLIIKAALKRKESLGAHYRIDDMEG